jgi:hypothetical protein
VTRLQVRVRPGARRDEVTSFMADGTLKVSVSAPPEEGRANRALIALLAETLGVSERQVRLTKGAGSRSKTVEVEGIEAAVVRHRLEAAMKGSGSRDE